jgi:DNA-binding transcriptional LysR family regulator
MAVRWRGACWTANILFLLDRYSAHMDDFELRHLRYFVAVAEELHFGRAAARLNIAQPPLSQQIRQLERMIGTALFVRTSRRTELTPAGAAFLQHARRLLADCRRAGDAARRAARGESATVVVGYADSAALSVLPGIVRRFRSAHPHVHLELSEGSTLAQITALERSVVDVALVRGPVAHAALHVETLLREPFVAALPADHALLAKRAIRLAALATAPFVLFPRHLAPAFHDDLITMCRRAGFSPDVRGEAAEYQTILSLVAAGIGVSIVPASVRTLGLAGVRFVPLVPDGTEATVVLARRAGETSSALAQFIAVARSGRPSAAARRRSPRAGRAAR